MEGGRGCCCAILVIGGGMLVMETPCVGGCRIIGCTVLKRGNF